MRNHDMTDHERIILHDTMWKMGIVPMETADTNIALILKTLPDEEAKRVKRKFRKAWRRIMKQRHSNGNLLHLRNGKPGNYDRRQRKLAVIRHVLNTVVEPKVSEFLNKLGEK